MIEAPGDIGLYIHIPFCFQKCRYCDFTSWSGMEDTWEPYINAVIHELAQKSQLAAKRHVLSVFIGGGTPSLLPYDYILRLMDAVRKYYNLLSDAEITIETNPGTLNPDKIRAYRDSGINRLSMGLQAWQDHLLRFLGRIHTARQFSDAVFMAQSHGFSNINADIIFGIPYQTLEDWMETITRVLSYQIPHVSCYSLTIEENTEFGRMRQEGHWSDPDEGLERDMYHKAVQMFGINGLAQYEISNFAKPHNCCRHNMNYWLRGEYLGFGSAAHSFHNGERYANSSELHLYIKSVGRGTPALSERSTITNEEALSESMILGLRLNRGIDLDELSSIHGTDIGAKYGKKLSDLVRRELVEFEGSVVRLTKRGLDFANQVFVELI